MKYVKSIIETILYVIAFLVIQMFVTFIVVGIQYFKSGSQLSELAEQAANGAMTPSATSFVIISIASSVLTLALFLLLHWTPANGAYLRSRPWTAMAWVAILALGTIIPSTWLGEKIPYEMPEEMEILLTDMMRNRWGYLSVGILVPLAEEAVFRGAILRVLLNLGKDKEQGAGLWTCGAIVVSAFIFGAVHGNVQQFVHATLIGLVIGWMYYRTGSIIPGIVFHWVNNSAAYVITNLIPTANDAKLVDIFGGDQRAVYMALGFSCCLIFPALFQLYLRLRKAE